MVSKQDLIAFEKGIAELFLRKHVRVPIHLSGGNEDELIRIFKDIKPTDYVFSTHRNHYHYLLHTGDTKGLTAELIGQANGVCSGCSGSMHTINHSKRFYSSGIVAGCVSIACGVAYALKLKNSDTRVMCFIGDGAADSGWFHESLRYSIANDLPIMYIIEDNDRSVCSSIEQRWGKKDLLPPWRMQCSKVIYYKYKPTYPHVGVGRHVTF